MCVRGWGGFIWDSQRIGSEKIGFKRDRTRYTGHPDQPNDDTVNDPEAIAAETDPLL